MLQARKGLWPWKDCPKLQVGFYLLVLACGFLFFQQRDLYHTVGSCFAMLDGHFLDFYDVNRAKFVRDEYLPIMYAIFAVWNIPVKLLGLVDDPAKLPFAVLAWSKLLLVLCFFGTAAAVGRSARTIGNGNPAREKLAARFFATAPIALFAVAVLGQYDIIGLLFAMWGFAFYLERRLPAFAWCFAVAACFKYFPLAIFFPLLFLAEKNILRLAKLTLIALSLLLVQIGVWSLDPFFRNTFFLHPLQKMHEAGHVFLTPLLLAAYAAGCLYAYFKKPRTEATFHTFAVFLPIFAFGVFFLTVTWHPQWIIVVMPFFALACLLVDAPAMLLLDWIGMLAFVWIDVNYWNTNCDVYMMQKAFLQDFCRTIPLQNNALMPERFLLFFRYVFHSYLFSPFLVLAWKYFRKKTPRSFASCVPFTLHHLPLLLFFLLPSFFCAFAPIPLAVRINPQAVIATLKPGLWLNTDSMTISRELTAGASISQSFVAEHDRLAAVGVKLTNFKRPITSWLQFSLYDASGALLASKTVPGRDIKNNDYFAFQVPPIAEAKGKRYSFTLTSPDAGPGNAFAVFVSTGDIYPEGKCSINGTPERNAMLFRLYYGREPAEQNVHP